MGLNSVAMIMAPNLFLCTNKAQPTLQEIQHAQGTVNIVRMLIKYQAILWTVSLLVLFNDVSFRPNRKLDQVHVSYDLLNTTSPDRVAKIVTTNQPRAFLIVINYSLAFDPAITGI